MNALSWLDDRTLMACFCMLVAVFSIMLGALRTLHPRLPGLASVTWGFATGAIAMMLLFAAGHLPAALGVVGGGGLTFVSSLLLYRGVLQFCRHQLPATGAGLFAAETEATPCCHNFLPLLSSVSMMSFATVVWCTWVNPLEAVRVVAITGTIALSRWLMCWTILRAARGRMHLTILGITVGVVALVTSGQALGGALFARTANKLMPMHFETPALLFAVLVVSVQGVLFLMMFVGMVTESIHEQAQLDYLTGVLNRRGIEAALEAEMARTRRTQIGFSMLLIDVDHFKAINDRFGHAVGDESLRTVAQTVLGAVRIYDRVGRFGGDEFMLLLPQTDSAEAMSTASRMIEQIRLLPVPANGMPLTVSIGATCWRPEEDQADVLVRADTALYEAKRCGRDRVQLNLGDTLLVPSLKHCVDEYLSSEQFEAHEVTEESLPSGA